MQRQSAWLLRTLIPLVSLLGLLLSHSASAHFNLSVNIRIVHVEHLRDGIRVYFRVPTPYLLADRLGAPDADGNREAAPYTYNRIEKGELMHYIDFDALHLDPLGLGHLLERGHHFTVDEQPLVGTVEAVRLYTAKQQPAFATLDEARAAFERPPAQADGTDVFVGDTVSDVIIHYGSDDTVYQYSVSSSLNPGLKDQEKTANLILDHFPGGTRVYRATGLLAEAITVSRSAWLAAWTFVTEGARHILEGYDHVLFVICLIIGATTSAGLLWRVTGFTLGHSITLAMGFFGWVPAAAWFIPAIETGIALSIIYAAAMALAQREGNSSFAVTTAIGLLHGLGFSFLLREILQINAPNLWHSLLAFNIGVEMGQLAIVMLIWPLVYCVQRYWQRYMVPLRWLIAFPCIAVAGLWVGERTVLFFDAVYG